VSPTIKHLFQGYDVTIFAYGSTGAGKTHTMRGGKSLVDRGMIPRMLSNIYRKSRAIEKSTEGETRIGITMSYYEIYNDRVFDLFDVPEKRNATGLPIREAEGGKTVVVGLTEMPCNNLKDFEILYDRANANRSTGATKLNAHSSRSHAILRVKVTITSPTETRVSTASAIDLAGSEDNRRTGNGKDRMVESASINKSLFVLAQCVEAISKKQSRIPYRESKMTRILSLGQNNGFTVMILNLAPTKAFHLDTLSSLNFANRTKKIEVREVENEPVFKGPARQPAGAALMAPSMNRQPLRPLTNVVNVNLVAQREAQNGKPAKAFDVYSDRSRVLNARPVNVIPQKSSPLKRTAENAFSASSRPNKIARPAPSFLRQDPPTTTVTKASIESIVEKKVSEILASRTLNAPDPAPQKDISSEVQKRLDSIEKRLEGQEGERAEGLSYLFMAKQHQARGEDGSALRMYELAKPHFPGNEKLERKIDKLKEKIQAKRESEHPTADDRGRPQHRENGDNDESYHDGGSTYEQSDDEVQHLRAKPRKPRAPRKARTSSPDPISDNMYILTPRTKYLLDIINSRDVSQIKSLNGLGAKRAEGIVDYLGELGDKYELGSWKDLTSIRGVGKKTLETMREGVVV
jgi:Kinesin motor domain